MFEVDNYSEKNNSDNKPCDEKYILEETKQVKFKVENYNKNSDIKPETDNLEKNNDDLTITK